MIGAEPHTIAECIDESIRRIKDAIVRLSIRPHQVASNRLLTLSIGEIEICSSADVAGESLHDVVDFCHGKGGFRRITVGIVARWYLSRLAEIHKLDRFIYMGLSLFVLPIRWSLMSAVDTKSLHNCIII